MFREIITSRGCLIGENFDILIQKGIIEEKRDSLTHKKWNALLDKVGLFDPDSNVELKDLFVFLKRIFERRKSRTTSGE